MVDPGGVNPAADALVHDAPYVLNWEDGEFQF